MTTRSQPNLPETLPAEPCEGSDLFRDYVGDGREYRGHHGECMNCGATFKESDDSDLATAHWSHQRAVARAIWHRDQPRDVRELATLMDPDDPMDATDHARALLNVSADERRAPVNGHPYGTVAWSEHVSAWEAYHRRHPEQDAERIAARGGFGIEELTYQLGRLPLTWRPTAASQTQIERYQR